MLACSNGSQPIDTAYYRPVYPFYDAENTRNALHVYSGHAVEVTRSRPSIEFTQRSTNNIAGENCIYSRLELNGLNAI